MKFCSLGNGGSVGGAELATSKFETLGQYTDKLVKVIACNAFKHPASSSKFKSIKMNCSVTSLRLNLRSNFLISCNIDK